MVASFAGFAARAETVTLTPEALRGAAMQASVQGRHAAALAMVQALLTRDPDDVAAHLVASRTYRDMGAAGPALTAALTASKLATTDEQRFSASMLVAQALSTAGRRTEAQLWLRWAANQAPTEGARAVAQRDFRYVRSRNPLKVDLSFSAAPTSNLNNGSAAEVATVYGAPLTLSGDARALSGLRVGGGATLTWRFPATERRQAQAYLSLYHHTHVLSDEAKAQAPNVAAEDFDYSSVSVGYRQVLSFGPGKGLWTWEASAGRSWYGRDPLADFAKLGLGRTFVWGEVGNVSVVGTLRHQRYVEGSGVRATSVGVTTALTRQVGQGGRVKLAFGVEDSMSDEPNVDYTAYRLSGEWRLGAPLAGAEVTLSAGVELREYPLSIYTPLPGRREDVSQWLSADFLFPKAQVWGFAPTVSAQYNLRASNADRYDTETFSIQLGVQSVF